MSADGGASWAEAALGDPVLPKALTRFRMPWRWDGGVATLMSGAVDESGAEQPRRIDWIAKYGPGQCYHSNAIQSWQVDGRRRVSNVHA